MNFSARQLPTLTPFPFRPASGRTAPAGRPCHPVPLRRNWCPWQDLHLHWPKFEFGASPLGYTGGQDWCSRSGLH